MSQKPTFFSLWIEIMMFWVNNGGDGTDQLHLRRCGWFILMRHMICWKMTSEGKGVVANIPVNTLPFYDDSSV
jgi:hypothetical protein